MIPYSLPIRVVKRFAVLLPGLFIAYLSVREVFPYFDRRLPNAFAVFITYVLAAYIFIPLIIRAFRIFRPADHLPLYCVTPDGFASDPLNVGIIGTRQELVAAMELAGWHVADQHNIRNTFREVYCTILGQPYPSAPLSSLYLFGRKQDIAFEIPIGNDPSSRHHVRFWATTYEEKQRLTIKNIHWQHRRAHVRGDNLLWVGSASLDVGLSFIRHNLQVSHMIHPDTDKERQLIVDQLAAVKLVKQSRSLTLQKPYRLTNRVMSGYLQTDGKMIIVNLNKLPKKP